jgi:hypothetical protein
MLAYWPNSCWLRGAYTLLNNLIVAQEMPCFYAKWKFVAVFFITLQSNQAWASWIQFIFPSLRDFRWISCGPLPAAFLSCRNKSLHSLSLRSLSVPQRQRWGTAVRSCDTVSNSACGTATRCAVWRCRKQYFSRPHSSGTAPTLHHLFMAKSTLVLCSSARVAHLSLYTDCRTEQAVRSIVEERIEALDFMLWQRWRMKFDAV